MPTSGGSSRGYGDPDATGQQGGGREAVLEHVDLVIETVADVLDLPDRLCGGVTHRVLLLT